MLKTYTIPVYWCVVAVCLFVCFMIVDAVMIGDTSLASPCACCGYRRKGDCTIDANLHKLAFVPFIISCMSVFLLCHVIVLSDGCHNRFRCHDMFFVMVVMICSF